MNRSRFSENGKARLCRKSGDRAMPALTESEARNKLLCLTEIYLAGKNDTPVRSTVELPIHLEAFRQVRTAVANTDSRRRPLRKERSRSPRATYRYVVPPENRDIKRT